jgi:hypothetical protein
VIPVLATLGARIILTHTIRHLSGLLGGAQGPPAHRFAGLDGPDLVVLPLGAWAALRRPGGRGRVARPGCDCGIRGGHCAVSQRLPAAGAGRRRGGRHRGGGGELSGGGLGAGWNGTEYPITTVRRSRSGVSVPRHPDVFPGDWYLQLWRASSTPRDEVPVRAGEVTGSRRIGPRRPTAP